MDFQSIIRESAGQGIVLLKNEKNMLPLGESDSISVFGRCQVNYYKSGTGSGGSVHVPFSVNLLDGFENLKKEGFKIPALNQELIQVYKNWINEHPFDSGNGEWASEPWCQVEMSLSDELVKAAAAKSKKAIFLIGRTAGEDQDNKAEEGSFYLTKTERENLRKICDSFEEVCVILNVSNIIDTSWLESEEFSGHIRALLYSWQGGMQGGQACADILCGKKSPSGKLSDTIAFKLEDYPSTKNFGSAEDEVYEEDIFVGYRYFTTFAKEKVQFPFGFGLSYTTFTQEVQKYDFDEENLYLEVKVTNSGSRTGAEIVQVYAECPQGKLGKAARVLCDFAKTKELESGKSEIVKISFPVKNLASYDDSGESGNAYSYILEEGIYSLYLGSDALHGEKILSKNGKIADGSEFTVTKTRVLEKLSQCCAPQKEFSRLKAGNQKSDGGFELLSEKVPLSQENLGEKIKANLPKELGHAELVSASNPAKIQFPDVVKNPALIDEFVASLSDKELMTLVRGEGMMSRKVTAGLASAFGGISQSLHDRGIPAVACSDGPSGIRMDNGKEASLVPIGTILACTWNPALVEDLYEALAKEMISKNIDVLLGPGCNIHRSPLNGRNFEYYSEDPLLSGKMAAAMCKGLARSGGIGTIKHFALNNQESHRRTENSVVSERALREIYLRPFEIAVKEGNARAVMTSYNGVNGHKSASNFDLNTSILRKEWGFTGLVMTDWWAAMNDCEKGGEASGRNMSYMIRARNDIYMVVVNDTAESGGFGDNLPEALKNGSLMRSELQVCVKDILLFITETYAAHVPLRPLKSEITISTVLDSVPAGVKIYAPEEYATDSALSGDMYFDVPETASYEVFGGFIKDGGDTLSQSISNVLINGESVGSFECRSTNGVTMYSVAVQLVLKKGVYKINLEHTKPGILVQCLCLRRERLSPISSGEYE